MNALHGISSPKESTEVTLKQNLQPLQPLKFAGTKHDEEKAR